MVKVQSSSIGYHETQFDMQLGDEKFQNFYSNRIMSLPAYEMTANNLIKWYICVMIKNLI